ncbi:hypothetical protein [Streptomyces sp. SP18BB07]|uniref:hypothetical protein n=1 Tax=Streptomyces sp. SP18BB07 TaxID=3002522 RepID=UPI003FCC5BC6
MVTLAYDDGLRREELVQLDVEDFEPAHRLIHLRAETTKSQRAREVAFGTISSQLFVAHLRERRTLFGHIDGPLFRRRPTATAAPRWALPAGPRPSKPLPAAPGPPGCPRTPSGICG